MSIRQLFTHPAGRGIRLGLACALLAWLLSQSALLRGLEDWFLDGWYSWRGTRPTQAKLVIIGIDDVSLDQLGKPLVYISPELAEVVSYADKQGASAIGLDLFVPKSLATLPEIEKPNGLGDPRPLGQAILDAGKVTLPQWRVEGGWQTPLPQWQIKALLNPEPADLAFVNLTEDDDQFVRRQQLLIRDEETNQAIPHFALALLARAQGAEFAWDDTRQELRLGDQIIPLDSEQKLRINFVGPPGSLPVLPFHQVIKAARNGQPMPELKNAILLIGLTARSQQDYHATPYANYYSHYFPGSGGGLMSGTEVHGNIIATLHDRAFITTPVWLNTLPLLMLIGAALGHLYARLSLSWGLLIAVLHHFAWKGIGLAAFTLGHWRVEVVGMLLLGVLLYGASFAIRWQILRRMMGVVKSEAIARALEADPQRLDPGGEEREVTVLFADIRSFTTFSEQHSPHEVVALLNAYFTAVVPEIEREEGTIDKFIGDGIMVLFGAPVSLPDHALHAVQAAIGMVRKVHQLKATWARLGNPDLRIGVGIHTGKLVVGAIGSKRRVDYTAIGDTVNSAARIESENKKFGTEILISEETYRSLSENDRLRLGCASEGNQAEVKGRAEPLMLYEVKVP